MKSTINKFVWLTLLTLGMALTLFWAVTNKEEQPKNWIEEPSNKLMDYE